jgi:hypothetical protein
MWPSLAPANPRRLQVLPENPALSRWTLSTRQFNRDWEFSWLARNLAPIKWVLPRCAVLCRVPAFQRGRLVGTGWALLARSHVRASGRPKGAELRAGRSPLSPARALAPSTRAPTARRHACLCRNQKIHWVSEPGSASFGVEIANRGQIRFLRKGPSACRISLTISYEVPDVLAPFANVGGRRGCCCCWGAACRGRGRCRGRCRCCCRCRSRRGSMARAGAGDAADGVHHFLPT